MGNRSFYYLFLTIALFNDLFVSKARRVYSIKRQADHLSDRQLALMGFPVLCEKERRMTEQESIEKGHGKWSLRGVPHKGWVCVEVEDLGEPATVCEMCETQTIRYVHYMQHSAYEHILRVGCICAGKMEGNLAEAQRRDDTMKSRAGKRQRWLNRRWKISAKGNEYIIAEGYIVTIFRKDGDWKASIKEKDGDRTIWSRRKYQTISEIKLASFDYITKLLVEDRNHIQ